MKRIEGRYLVLGVFTAVLLLFILAPIIIVVINSFNGVAYNVFPPEGLSLQWYVNLAKQKEFYGAALRSVWVAVASTILALTVGTLASIALARHKLPAHDLIKSFFLSPIVLPKIVLGVALFMFFVRVKMYGGYASLIISHATVSLPFVIAILSANLAGLDRTLEEAAADLGAGALTTFFRVTLPQISVGMLVSALFAFIISFDQVETTVFLVRPSTQTLPIEMFLYMQKWQDPTIAALSTLLILFSAALVFVLGLALRRVDIVKVLGSGNSTAEGKS